jgi:hypothetical protein
MSQKSSSRAALTAEARELISRKPFPEMMILLPPK